MADSTWYLREANRATSKLLMFGLEKFAEIVREEVDKGAVGSIKGKTRVTFGLRSVKIINDHPAAAFKEFGTPPHVITPDTKAVLRWFDPSSGKAIFAKRVFHPGTKPDPFFRIGISKARKKAGLAF